eukprot:Rhum_TRINITY_DN5836_c0_g1::Rhum_TRINITY_DN5836_c0_g1_i1::g.18576::m.18576/K01194/TREH, treA, treF; alpha,alpha-trehalase
MEDCCCVPGLPAFSGTDRGSRHTSSLAALAAVLLVGAAVATAAGVAAPGARPLPQVPLPQGSGPEWASHGFDAATGKWAHEEDFGVSTTQRLRCEHPVYCRGDLLRNVQMLAVFNDSKTFVDMPIRTSVAEVLQAFDSLSPAEKTDVAALRSLLAHHFEPAGSELVSHTPRDWTPTPPVLQRVRDPSLRQFAEALNGVWLKLSKKYVFKKKDPTCYSSVEALAYPFVVPGGRFREFYYWDTYWIVEGLLVSGMIDTVEGIVLNMAILIETFGFVPNGARIYYANRSQPPVFAHILVRFAEAAGFFDGRCSPERSAAVRRGIRAALTEHAWWLSSGSRVQVRDGSGRNHSLNAYRVQNVTSPRPESYREDVATAATWLRRNDTAFAEKLWAEITSAAESGWDFSSRWLGDRRQVGNISTIRTSQVVPVDLNTFLYHSEGFLARLLAADGQRDEARRLAAFAADRRAAMMSVLWSDEECRWADYNLTARHRSTGTYLSDFSPLFAGLRPAAACGVDRVVDSLRETWLRPGGLPTSLVASGQQWDYPNAWPPLQYMVVVGLNAMGGAHAESTAKTLALRWIDSNYCGWKLSGYMFEKYNATHPGLPGSGGEYTVQEGFGWTNGVMLWLLNRYGADAVAPNCTNTSVAQ